MQSASFAPRQTRSHYRHELRTLTYVTLDEANGGVIRNLNPEGVAVQAVAPLRQDQRVRLRFELRFPRLRVDAFGQVSWTKPSGQCGVRFVDLSERATSQINQWIFSNLLDSVAREATHTKSMFEDSVVSIVPQECTVEEADGLTVSASARPAIRLEPRANPWDEALVPPLSGEESYLDSADTEMSWLSRPLAPRTLAWLVDGLVVTAALLLFALIFLSIARELPQWPLTLSAAAVAAAFVAAAYWSVFAVFGGPSLGVRLAQAASSPEHDDDGEADRFR